MEEFLKKETTTSFELESDKQTEDRFDLRPLPHVLYFFNYLPAESGLGERINLFDCDIRKIETDALAAATSLIKAYDQLEAVS